MSKNVDELVTGYLVEIVRVCSDAGLPTTDIADALDKALPRIKATAEACEAFVQDGHKGELISALEAAELASRPAPEPKGGRLSG